LPEQTHPETHPRRCFRGCFALATLLMGKAPHHFIYGGVYCGMADSTCLVASAYDMNPAGVNC
jgi:hypothetical protein